MPPVPVEHEVGARVECPDPDSKYGVNMVRDRLKDRTDILFKIKTLEMMYCLRMIANKFHIGVYVTNHEEMGLTDAKIKRSLKQGLYFKEVKDLRKLNNAVQVTTGNSSLGDMHQGGDMHEERYNGCTKTVCGRKHETVCANSQRLLVCS
ncbi:Os12g0179000 [Oryza sativa Japonica Group]|uniref:Os12g0179000 protein n=1 Tax=Oryza sativa subsp. japonica TaxID=39947 RepID=A0A0P0Y7Q7_ORYSJ|nr:Os12g0179000 [Oryza sativa Japonica Group]